MKMKTVEVGVSYTFQPEPYHSCRAEVKLTADVTEEINTENKSKEVAEHYFEVLRVEVMKKWEALSQDLVEAHTSKTQDTSMISSGW
jgi:hypothetical protein